MTAVDRGTANTRWRDFVDVVGLAGAHPVDGDEVTGSIRSVAEFRESNLEPLTSVLDGYADIGQDKWARWRRKQGLEDRTPEEFGELLDAYLRFAGPAVSGDAAGRRWDPAAQVWA